MRKLFFFGLLFSLALVIFFILISAFPKNVSLLPSLLVLMILDGYLWLSVKDLVFNQRAFVRYTILGIYWFPLILLTSSIITGMLIPFLSWGIILRTYIPGVILTTYICKVFPILFLFIADVLRVFSFFFNSFIHGKGAVFSYFLRNKWVLFTGWLVGGILYLLMVLGMTCWNYGFQIRNETLKIPELPESFDGLRIVQISDIHLGSWVSKTKLEEAIAIINSLNPDLIFFTGDIANYSTDEVFPFENILSHIRSRMGVFAILGNHDYGDYVTWPSAKAKERNMEDLFAFYQRLGWKLLMNEHCILKKNNDSIAILGVQNWGKTMRFQRFGDVKKAQHGIENMAVQFLLTHDPSNWEYVVSRNFKNIDISFSGHTHGFQVGIECCGFQWSPAQYLYDEWAGLYSKPVPGSHQQYLYVNRGLGSIGYPGRIGMPPEITLFTIRRN
jgi:uncharacterized protein